MNLRNLILNPRFIVRSASVFVALVVGVLGTMDAQAASNNLLIAPSSDTNNVNGTIGYKFTAASENGSPTIKGLGFVDAGNNGLATSHQVGLYHWNGSAYALERSVTIGAGTSYYLDGGYRWYPISDYTLSDSAANAYFLGATVSSGDGDLWGGVGSAYFSSVGDGSNSNTAQGSSSSSLLPATWNGSFPVNTFYNAPNATMNVVPVPEPSTYAMALAGLAYGGCSLFRRRKRA